MAGLLPKHPFTRFLLLTETKFSTSHLSCSKDFIPQPPLQVDVALWSTMWFKHRVLFDHLKGSSDHLKGNWFCWDPCSFALSYFLLLLTWNPCRMAGVSVLMLDHEEPWRWRLTIHIMEHNGRACVTEDKEFRYTTFGLSTSGFLLCRMKINYLV